MKSLHIGLICPPLLGHLNPTIVLGNELKSHGFNVSLITLPCHYDVVKNLRFQHITYGNDIQTNMTAQKQNVAVQSLGLDSVKNMFSTMSQLVETSFDELPEILNNTNIDILVSDHVLIEIPTICEYLELPFITLCNAMISRFSLKFPPSYYLGEYSNNYYKKLCNAFGYFNYVLAASSLTSKIVKQRKLWKMRQSNGLKGIYSPLSVLCQQTVDIEYPLDSFVKNFNFLGPLLSQSNNSDFNASELFDNEYPLIYVSLGTIRNDNFWIYETIASCLRSSEFNLLISTGHKNLDRFMALKASNIAIESFVDQVAVLNHSSLCITHAGMNTTMHCVYTATPMIAIPLANEQPGIASRIRYSGAGLVIKVDDFNAQSLSGAINEVYNCHSYRDKITKYQSNCLSAGGVTRAVQIISGVIEELSL